MESKPRCPYCHQEVAQKHGSFHFWHTGRDHRVGCLGLLRAEDKYSLVRNPLYDPLLDVIEEVTAGGA